MPTTYAHKKFGALVYKNLPNEIKLLINDNYEYFLAGLHGPDVLFFHKPGFKSNVPEIGKNIHKKPFKLFYDRAIKFIKENPYEEYTVYLLGCICHFVLDKECHPIVAEGIEATGLSHGKIEMELDRELIIKDGHTPIKYPAYAHIPVSKDVAEIAAPFYKGVSEGAFLSSLATMKTVYAACGSGNTQVRKFICKVMELANNSGKIASLIMSKDKSNMAHAYVLKMIKKMNDSIDEAVEDIENACADIADKMEKNPEYKYNFSGKKIG